MTRGMACPNAITCSKNGNENWNWKQIVNEEF